MIATSSLQQDPVTIPVRPFGPVVRSVAGYGLLLALMFISPLFVFVPAAIFHCGIRNRRWATVGALAIGTALAGLVALQTGHGPTAGLDALMGYAYLAALVLAVAIPALLVLPMVERGEGFGSILVTAILASLVGLAVTELGTLLMTGISPYHEQVVRAHQTAAQFLTVYRKAEMPSDAVATLGRWMDVGISCLPAFFLIDIAIVFVLSLVMFGRVKAWRQFVAMRETTAAAPTTAAAAPTAPYLFRNLSLPEWLLFAFVIGGMTPLATGIPQKVAANVLAIVVFLYLLQGLAIFRSLLVAVGAGFMGVMFGYLVLAFLTITGIAPVLLSIAGLFDSFFDFRHFRRKDHSDESHPH
jgi:hypothetical protein